MIELIGRDPAWKALWFIVFDAAISGFLIHSVMQGQAARITAASLASCCLILLLSYMPAAQQASNAFFSSLPLHLKDIFAARVIATALLIWLPVAALEYWVPSRPIVDMAILATLCMTFIHALSMKQKSRLSVWAISLPATLAAAPILFLLQAPVAEIALAIACAAVFLWGRQTVPLSFRLHTARQVEVAHESHRVIHARATLWRSLYSWRSLVGLPGVTLETFVIGNYTTWARRLLVSGGLARVPPLHGCLLCRSRAEPCFR